MKISDSGIEIVKHFEGCRLKPYKDVAGLWTIGIGHLLTEAEFQKYRDGISMETAISLFKQDIKRFEVYVVKAVSVPLSQQQFDALTSFTFNIGSGAFSISTLRKRLNKGDYDGAALEFLRWNKAKDPKTGKMKAVSGLTRRRKVESDYFKGVSLDQIKAKNWYV